MDGARRVCNYGPARVAPRARRLVDVQNARHGRQGVSRNVAVPRLTVVAMRVLIGVYRHELWIAVREGSGWVHVQVSP